MPIPQHILDIVRPVQFVEHNTDDAPEDYPPRCSDPKGHNWFIRDDDRCLCAHCGADGDA